MFVQVTRSTVVPAFAASRIPLAHNSHCEQSSIHRADTLAHRILHCFLHSNPKCRTMHLYSVSHPTLGQRFTSRNRWPCLFSDRGMVHQRTGMFAVARFSKSSSNEHTTTVSACISSSSSSALSYPLAKSFTNSVEKSTLGTAGVIDRHQRTIAQNLVGGP
jgi:hypothetical protein